MPISTDAILKDLKAKKYQPIYFLHGEEPYYIDRICDFLENKLLPEADKAFNQTVVYGKDMTVNAILGAAKRFPMMADRQLVMVKEAQEITDLGQEKSRAFLLQYVQKPLPTTILVFAHKNKKLDSRTNVGKELDKKDYLIESKKMYDNQIPKWISELVKEKGHSIGDKAAIVLSEYIGNDLNRINNEIDKLLINFQTKIEINEDIIAKYVGISKEYNTFELQSAIAIKNVLKANRIINYFEANPKNNPLIPIIALLFGYFTKLMLIHQSKDKSKNAIASVLRLNPFFVDEYLTASKNYPVDKVVKIISYLRTADLQSKGVGSTAEDGQILRELVFKILHD
jgi:DNA polymerase-3 subunit delta